MQMCDIDSIWREIKVSRPKAGTNPRTNFGEITFHTGVRTQTILELTNLEATLRQCNGGVNTTSPGVATN